ncbi:MAG: DUF2075 domain-containing protein, partial [Acetobacteraceae bacterium]
AWRAAIVALRDAVAMNHGDAWTVALEYDLVRLERRIDAVLVTAGAILVLEFKSGEADPAGRRQVEDYALDLADFHAGSRTHPVVPILVAGSGPCSLPDEPPLLWHGVLPPFATTHEGLGRLVGWIIERVPPAATPLDGAAWLAAPYRPVPGIVEAATMLYARHGVAEIAAARADRRNLTRTAEAIDRAVAAAKDGGSKVVVFVTGIPGSGKTLCGLNAVFGRAREDGAAFLTGNVPLVTVLREALARDAASRGEPKRLAVRRVKAALQNVHRFLEDHALHQDRLPPERLIVFDEAQRAWDAAKARAGTPRRPGRLTLSEPAHTLEIMGRREGWSVVVALIGGGQEINTGEAGLAEWERAIAAAGGWRAVAPPQAVTAADPVQRLADGTPVWLTLDPDLHLDVSIRSVRDRAAAAWVEALLDGRTDEARRLAEAAGGVPFLLTRDAPLLRAILRALARGNRRAGLVRASTAKRLRADGFGPELVGDEVACWFLDRWPDVRASDALEVCATEYACQGLELDVVGLVWGNDFLPDRSGGWRGRSFAGTRWQKAERDFAFLRNTYRVLLTRARRETVILVPRGDAADPTRPPEEFDAIARRLEEAGACPVAPDGTADSAAAAGSPLPAGGLALEGR